MKQIRPQIGDWFSFYDAIDNNTRQWVVSDYAKYSQVEVEGVTLTKYLLLLNGFKPLKGCWGYILRIEGITIELNTEITVSIKGKGSFHLPSPQYVHEYQQILRVCGLIELADNFRL